MSQVLELIYLFFCGCYLGSKPGDDSYLLNLFRRLINAFVGNRSSQFNQYLLGICFVLIFGGIQLPVDSAKIESGSFVSRCSVRLIFEVMSKFDSQKRDLVKSVGFEGILHFTSIKQFDRKFSLWLMSCVDEHSSTINIGHHISLPFSMDDVGHIFGIPFSGRSVLGDVVASTDAKEKVI